MFFDTACIHLQTSLDDGSWPRSQLQSTLEAQEEERSGVHTNNILHPSSVLKGGNAPQQAQSRQVQELGDGVRVEVYDTELLL
jgi:hypothetical protein